MRHIGGTVRHILAGIAIAATTTAVALSGGVASAADGQGSIQAESSPDAIKDSYLVVLSDHGRRTGPNNAAANLTKRYGGTVRRTFDSAVHGFAVSMPTAAAKRLAADPDVAYVEQDRRISLTGTQTNPPSWGLDRIDQQALPLSGSYTYPNTAANVHAYIIDTGVRTSHTDLGGRAGNGWDFIDNDPVANDCHGHGTHVAGTVAGSTYGVAKNVSLVGVRVLDCNGSGSYSQIISGVDWVTKNAVKPAVANMSLGGSASSTLDTAVRNSIASGVTYALAAGNDNTNACNSSPARLGEAITVGATDATDARASFSNYGTCLDLFAPGVSILSSYHSSDTATARMSGTSMASPHVAGAAALVLAANPSATPQQVRDRLVNAATTGKVSNPGNGSPNRLLYTGTAGTVTPPPSGCTPVTNGTDVQIPDLTTVTSSTTMTCTGTASTTAKVEVHIRHTYRGDLVIDLVAPDTTSYRLKSADAYDSADDVHTTYTVNLSAEQRNGTWKLRVRDSYAADTGTLDSWTLTL
jgi:subtilisin family serine protease